MSLICHKVGQGGDVGVDGGASANGPDPSIADPMLVTAQRARKVVKGQKNVPGWGDWS